MSFKFSAFAVHYNLFEKNRVQIVDLWLTDTDFREVLNRHEISADYFTQKFASPMLDYFLAVAKEGESIGNTPVISDFLQLLVDKDISTSELFTMCTKFRKTLLDFTYKEKINTELLYTDIVHIFDKNFEGILDTFSKTINQTKLALQQTDKMLQEYKTAVDHASLVSITDKDGVITYANDAFCQVSGFSREELIGSTHNIVRHEEMSSTFFKKLWHTIQDGKIFHDTIKNKNKRGSYYFVDTVIVPMFDCNNLITGYLSVRQDITDYIEALESSIVSEELALIAKDEALQAEKSKDDFLSNMSHEIRTPLNAILGFVQLLEKSDLNSKDRGYLNVISNSGKTLLALINDILDFAKIRSGKFSLDPFEFDPIYEFENTVELFTSKMNEKKIDYLVYIDPDLPMTLKADAIRIKQILLNFLGNAVKFTSECGSVRVQILYDEEKGLLSLYVKDSGIGIKEKNKLEIFSAFSQEETSTARKFGGTGLGLSISKSLTELMDGEIGLESEEGKGSTFFVHIPVKKIKDSRVWNSDKEVALYFDRALENNFKLLQKYFSKMKILTHVMNDPNERPSQPIVIFSRSYYKKHICDTDKEKAFEEKNVILIDYADSNHERSAVNVGILSLPLYPTKIFKHFDYEDHVENNVGETKQYNGHVLVAEDNKTNEMLITILLDEYGLTYRLAEDGEQAFEAFQKESFDLILMDNNMPKMSGIEATERILRFEQENGMNYTPIIALTANASNEYRERFLASGMDDFLAKPLNLNELERVLDTYLESVEPDKKLIQDLSDQTKLLSSESENIDKGLLFINYDALSAKIGLPPKMIAKLVESFMEDTPKILEKLKNAIETNNRADTELYAHSIKGSAANLSLEPLLEKAKEIEWAAKANETAFDYAEAFELIQTIFNSIKE